MSDYQRYYVPAAFVAGIILTLGYKEFYTIAVRSLRRQTAQNEEVQSHEQGDSAKTCAPCRSGPPGIVEGVEGCIGNTPLLRIKSLSEATGCEVLAKAEVWIREIREDLLNSTLFQLLCRVNTVP